MAPVEDERVKNADKPISLKQILERSVKDSASSDYRASAISSRTVDEPEEVKQDHVDADD